MRDGAWPWATLAANLAGTLLLALVLRRLDDAPRGDLRRALLGTGFCGALTTFSTLQLELLELALRGQTALALAYLVASVAAWVGIVAAVAAGSGRRRVA